SAGFGGGAAVAEFGGAANGHESAYSSQGGFESAGGVNNSFASILEIFLDFFPQFD
ncbi:unnamed protein product, partial [Rotaria magnacalcarata]